MLCRVEQNSSPNTVDVSKAYLAGELTSCWVRHLRDRLGRLARSSTRETALSAKSSRQQRHSPEHHLSLLFSPPHLLLVRQVAHHRLQSHNA
jgi:hypothetical protein